MACTVTIAHETELMSRGKKGGSTGGVNVLLDSSRQPGKDCRRSSPRQKVRLGRLQRCRKNRRVAEASGVTFGGCASLHSGKVSGS